MVEFGRVFELWFCFQRLAAQRRSAKAAMAGMRMKFAWRLLAHFYYIELKHKKATDRTTHNVPIWSQFEGSIGFAGFAKRVAGKSSRPHGMAQCWQHERPEMLACLSTGPRSFSKPLYPKAP